MVPVGSRMTAGNPRVAAPFLSVVIPYRSLQNLNMAPVVYFSVVDIFRNIFNDQYTLCNETEKTEYVMEIENKHDLRRSC